MKTRHMPNEDPRERMKELKTKNNQMKTCTAKINRGIYNGYMIGQRLQNTSLKYINKRVTLLSSLSHGFPLKPITLLHVYTVCTIKETS